MQREAGAAFSAAVGETTLDVMPRLARSLGPLLVAFSFTAAACNRTPPEQSATAASDSIAIRVLYKGWGNGETAECSGEEWGWDSVTWRLAPGNRAHVLERPPIAHLRLKRILSPDSAVIWFKPFGMSPADTGPPLNARWPDSVVISARPIRFESSSVDAGWYFLVHTVSVWPEPRRKPVRTATLVGRVVDVSSNRPLRYARVVVLGTTISESTDATGRFTLGHVPVGRVRLDVCAGCFVMTRLEVTAPTADSLVVRLRLRPGCTHPS
jgi:hypothetical protein